MEKKIHSTKYARQRRFLMILPILTIPSLSLMFWAFGGGKGNNPTAQVDAPQGMNFKLPDPKLKQEKTLNKLGFYDQAALDSAKIKEAEKFDPYWNNNNHDVGLDSGYAITPNGSEIDANQTKVYDKLDELKKALTKSQEASGNYSPSASNPYSLKNYSSSNDVEGLKSMMQNLNRDKTEDPEINQLNNMLDKIQAIQEPERTIKTDSARVQRLAIKLKGAQADISLLKPDFNRDSEPTIETDHYSDNAFYSTDFFNSDSNSDSNTIEAIIPETQSIVTGSTIKLALCNEVTIQHITLPTGTFIYGTASISDERLKIDIASIRIKNDILPVSLSVFDMDGQEGIHVPGSIDRTVSKESANNALSGMNMTTLDASAGAQAASAGIEAAKTLLSRKIKLVRISVKAGYKVLLKDSQ